MSLAGRRIGFIGGGAMAEALAGGLIAGGVSAAQIRIAEPLPERCTQLRDRLGVAAGVDGSLWAIDYRRIADHDEQQTLAVYSDGEWRHVQTSENAHGVVTARDGSVWVAVDSSAGSLARVVGDELEHVDVVFGGIDHLVAAPDGSVWMAGGDGELIERQGVTDIEVDLLRYDGSTVSAITVPFPEISALAIAPDGTVWAASYLYGVFSYDATEWDQYDLTNGMPEGRVEFLEVGPDGSVYAGTSIGVVHIRPAT